MSENTDLNIIQKLQRLGLSDKEALVYTELLSGRRREVSAIEISKSIPLHRQFVYDALKALEKRGLVLKIGDTRSKWRALSPRKFVTMAERHEHEAISVSEELARMMTRSAGQEFELIEGTLAFRERQIASIRKVPTDSVMLMICGQWERYFSAIGDLHYREYERIRTHKNITIRFVGPRAKEGHMRRSSIERPLVDYRYVPGLETGLVNTIIYGDTVDFEIYGSPHVTFSIKNPDVAESQRLFFESLWQIGTK